jgi:hypothetical protein
MNMFKTPGTGQQEPGDKVPRNYNFWDFWRITFCPNFTVFAFPFVIWLINTALYIAILIGAGVKGYPFNTKVFAGV